MTGSETVPRSSGPLRLADGAGGLVAQVDGYAGDGVRLRVPAADVALDRATAEALRDWLCARYPDHGELITQRGIESRWKVSTKTVWNWRHRHGFPAPVLTDGGRPVWIAADVADWVRTSRPRRGRPPAAPASL